MRVSLALVLVLFLIGCASKNILLKKEIKSDELIAYIIDKSKIFLVNANGSNKNEIYSELEQEISHLSWSTNNEKLAFYLSSDTSMELNVINISNQKSTKICDIKNKRGNLFNSNRPIFISDSLLIFPDSKGLISCDLYGNKKTIIQNDSIIDYIYEQDHNTVIYSTLSLVEKQDIKTNENTLVYNSDINEPIKLISISKDGMNLAFVINKTIYIVKNEKPFSVISALEIDLPVYWLYWYGDKIIYQTGLRTEHTTFISQSTGPNFGSSLGNFKRRHKGKMAFYISDIYGDNKMRIYKKLESAKKANPDLDKSLNYITIVSNSLNSLNKLFLVSTKNGKVYQLTSDGLASFPVWQE